MDILDVGYRSTHYYLLVYHRVKLLFDAGWPGTMPEMKKSFAQHGLSVKDVDYVLISHYHIDHAGMAQDLKDKGAKLIVMENQTNLNIPERWIRDVVYHPAREEGNIHLKFADSRAFLHKLGIEGEIIRTRGHGEDHVTLVLDAGIAFTGDLPPPNGTEPGSEAEKDWERLRSLKAKRVFPAHGAFDIPLDDVTSGDAR
jgi:glyoxylase-like metal-dependent hydrolase (beta-lactamase superfamily II)